MTLITIDLAHAHSLFFLQHRFLRIPGSSPLSGRQFFEFLLSCHRGGQMFVLHTKGNGNPPHHVGCTVMKRWCTLYSSTWHLAVLGS